MLKELPSEIEEYRDRKWRREGTLRVETAVEAERFIEETGFSACLTDARQPGPSLYVAVCGRRDAVMPHNVQKDPESSLAWVLKDEIVRRGKVYYGKMARGKTLFLSRALVPHFHSVMGIPRSREKSGLGREAQAILRALRKEWEMGTSDLREEAGIADRKAFNKAMDELQTAMIVIPSEVVYQPKFSYIWTLAEARFPAEISRKIARGEALREIARAFLKGAGMTVPGELARATGLSRPDAGKGNRALVSEGFASSPEKGVYIMNRCLFAGDAAGDPAEDQD